jgi:archaellum component FlaC
LEVDELKEKIKEIKKSETKLLEDLRAKYGNVNINIETGEIS